MAHVLITLRCCRSSRDIGSALRFIRFPLHGVMEPPIAPMFLILPWLAAARGVKSRNFYH
jgi:hypothetical protein